MRKLLAELRKLAITFEEYKNLHPKTRKTPDDPMFSKVKGAPTKGEQPAQANQPAQETKTKPKPKRVKKDDTSNAIEAFKPKLTPSPYQKKMSEKEFHNSASKMSQDDVAWHIMNGEVAAKDTDELRKVVWKHMGVADYYALTLLNPHVSKQDKDDAASYILDKSGVSFVASKKLKDFIFACAKKGIISKEAVKYEEESDAGRKERDEISDMSAENLLKLPKNKVQENWKEVCWNTNASPQFLESLLADKAVQKGINAIKNGYIEDSGYMVNVADRKGAIEKALNLLQNPNLPFERIKFLEGSMDTFMSTGNYKAQRVAKILANHPDINKPENKALRDKVLKVFQTPLFGGVPDKESIEDPFTTKEKTKYTASPPSSFKMSEEEFMGIHANFDKDDDFENLYDNPACPTAILKKALTTRSKNWRNKYTKPKVFDLLMARKALTDKEMVATVKKNLMLDGDPDLLKRFAKQAYISGKQPNLVKRTITKSSEEDKQRIKEEMAKTAKHEEFDFEVLESYDIDKDPNEKFEATSKEIGNVKSLYHGTSYSGAGGILSTGIQISDEHRTGAMFGQGFYMASDSSKAAQYAGENFSQHEGEGVVLMLNAALGKTKEMKYGQPQHDELSFRNLSPEEKTMQEEYEKKTGKKMKNLWHYDHDSVTARAGTSLMYDEYVVKDPSQVQVQKIVIIKKKPKAKT